VMSSGIEPFWKESWRTILLNSNVSNRVQSRPHRATRSS
jgi:hypothetical protein